MQWPFSRKNSAPQILSFSNCQDEKPKLKFENGYVLESNYDHPAPQVTSITDKRGGPCSVNSASIRRKSGQKNPVNSMNPWLVTKDPVTTASGGSPHVGTMDLRDVSKTSSAPTQLTIFYNGSVSVYNNISPEKAQAIMLLAGNEQAVKTPVAAPVPVPASEPYVNIMSQNYYPNSSIHDSHQRRYSNHGAESGKSYPSIGTISQLRRKSLARFVEKRQQRIVNMGMHYSKYQDKESSSCSSNSRGSFILNSQDLSSRFDPTHRS